MVLPFRNNPVYLNIPAKGRTAFIPTGKMTVCSMSVRRKNPVAADYRKFGDSRVARIFVGLSVKGRQTYSMDYLVALTRDFLRKCRMPEDSSFMAQKGVYTHEKTRKVVEEDSAQVIIINMGKPDSKFESTVIKLGEHICKMMSQESVIIDYQRNGMSEHIWSVVP